jgi:hypothetical protein
MLAALVGPGYGYDGRGAGWYVPYPDLRHVQKALGINETLPIPKVPWEIKLHKASSKKALFCVCSPSAASSPSGAVHDGTKC